MNTVNVLERQIAPTKIVCVGWNYVEHIHELGNEIPEELVVFCKPNSAVTATLRSFHQEPLHYEAEICYIVENGVLAAVGCGLDLTKRVLQSRLKSQGRPWERAKAFDGSALFSPFVPLPDRDRLLGVELEINGVTRQRGTTELMIRKPEDILREIQTFMTLCDGDIIMTGTPAGVGEVKAGDEFVVRLTADGEYLVGCSWQAA